MSPSISMYGSDAHRSSSRRLRHSFDAANQGDVAEQHVAVDVREHVDHEQGDQHAVRFVFPAHGAARRRGLAAPHGPAGWRTQTLKLLRSTGLTPLARQKFK